MALTNDRAALPGSARLRVVTWIGSATLGLAVIGLALGVGGLAGMAIPLAFVIPLALFFHRMDGNAIAFRGRRAPAGALREGAGT